MVELMLVLRIPNKTRNLVKVLLRKFMTLKFCLLYDLIKDRRIEDISGTLLKLFQYSLEFFLDLKFSLHLAVKHGVHYII